MNDASSPESGNPGVILREARLRRGLSQEQVTAETNISPRYVQALEEDDYSALPGQAFARGYLRRYAQLVQVDADVLVPAFDRLWLQQHPAPAAGLAAPAAARKAATSAASRPARTGSLMDQGIEQVAGSVSQISLSRLLSVGSLALLALLLIGTLFWQGDDEPEVPRIDESMPLDIDAEMAGSASPQAQPQPELPPLVEPQPAAPVALPPVTDAATAVDAGAAPAAGMAPGASPAAPAATAVIPVAAPVAASAPRPVASQPPAATVIPVAPQPAATLAPVAAPATVKPATAPTATAPTAAPPVKPGATQPLTTPAATPSVDTLNFGFTGKSWISVRDATGQELVYGLKGEGQTVTVTGQAPFSINIGNVKVTTMTRNGKPVSLKPYTRGEIASFRLNK